MSQNRPAETVDRIIDELETASPYASPALAARCVAPAAKRCERAGGDHG